MTPGMTKASDNLVERLRAAEALGIACDACEGAATRIEKLQAALLEAGEALEHIAGAPLYRTRTDNGRICKAEETRDVARAALTPFEVRR
jgi:hypothetical protein